MRYIITTMAVLFLIAAAGLEAKEAIEIPLIDTPPVIDGKLDDAVWTTAVRFEKFVTFKPDYGKEPTEKTVVYACTDRENFYFAARCFEKDVSLIKGAVTRRDNVYDDDFISFNIDTYYNKQSAFAFVVNPQGIQGDGMTNADGDMDSSQDMVWYSKGNIDEKGYTVEIKIPFKSIRFPVKKKAKMGLWIVRQIVRTSEYDSFPEIFPDKGATLTQAQPVVITNMKYKRVLEILPAVTHSRIRDREAGQWSAENTQSDFSLTGKVGITTNLVLDATYNPDFSQVEADAGQVDVNLRYSLYYQEKRPFFLEGLEAFRLAGNTEEAPLGSVVHTRTIIDPVFGLKLSGKVGRKNTIASIFALDEPLANGGESDAPRPAFGIFRFRHVLKEDSYFGGFYTGREVSGEYNRVVGIDGRFRLTKYSMAEYHLLGSFTRREGEEKTAGHALGLRYSYGTRKVYIDVGLQDISPDFQVDSGYLTRQGVTRVGMFGMYMFYPKSKIFQRVDPFYWGFHLLDKESNLLETFNLFTLRVNMTRSSTFRLDMVASNEVFAGRRFSTGGIGFQTRSQITRHLSFTTFFRHTGSIYYNPAAPYGGRSSRGFIILDYRPAEKFRTSLNFTYEDFYRKSDSQKIYDYILVRSRTTFQLNKYLFFRGIAEYNSYWKQLNLDALASFTYIPGTVVHVGYGAIHEKIQWDGEHYVPADRFLETHRAFFFKLSYLWRL